MLQPERRIARSVLRTPFLFTLSLLIFFLNGLSRSVAPELWLALMFGTAYV